MGLTLRSDGRGMGAGKAAETQGRAAWWLATLVAAALLVSPLFVVEVPPLEDYPNHLARMYLLAYGARDPVLSHMYAPAWHIIPNLGMDLITPPLVQVLPLHVAGRIVLGLVMLLLFAGMIVLHRAIHDRRSWWPLASALITCNGIFLLGFLNFLLGIGVALLVGAFWTAKRERQPVLAAAGLTFGAILAFFVHMMGLVFLGTIVTCTIAEDALNCSKDWFRVTIRRALVVAIAFVVPILLYFSSPLAAVPGLTRYGSWKGKVGRLFVAFVNYNLWLDGCVVLLVCLVAIYCIASGRNRVPQRSLFAISLLLAAYIVAPWAIKGNAWFDFRFALMATIVVFVGLDPILPRNIALGVAALLAIVFAARTAVIAEVWYKHNADITGVRQTISAVPAGSRVLVVRAQTEQERGFPRTLPGEFLYGRTDDYLSALLIPERKAFWPLLFTTPSQQPLTVLPPYDSLSASTEDPPDYSVLRDPAQAAPFPYLRDWRRRFDYVLLMDPDDVRPGTNDLEPVSKSNVAKLFVIRHKN
jgi:hypothetical protein